MMSFQHSWHYTGSKSQGIRDATTYVQLNDPQQSDEQKVKGHKQAEGSPNIWDALLFSCFVRLDAGRKGSGVDGPRTPHTAAALAGHDSSVSFNHVTPFRFPESPTLWSWPAQKKHTDNRDILHSGRSCLKVRLSHDLAVTITPN